VSVLGGPPTVDLVGVAIVSIPAVFVEFPLEWMRVSLPSVVFCLQHCSISFVMVFVFVLAVLDWMEVV
jgi:hypothetical protein